MKLKLISILIFVSAAAFAQGTVINVNSVSQLKSAVKNLFPGDTVVVADGTYNFGGNISITNSGSEEKNIVIRAKKIGGVILTGESYFDLKQVSYVVIEGFNFHSTDVTAVKTEGCNHVRITRNSFKLTETSSLKWIVIGGVWNDPNIISSHNRIDHNIFEGKSQAGNCITIDGTSDPTYQSSRYDIIDHNYFKNIGPRIDNGMETIRIGWSELSMSSGFTTVEYNLFEDCDGDPEIISVKSSDDTIRYNTFKRSQGTLCLRHGNRSSAYGNFFLGENKSGTGGIRVYGDDHKIFNNYFQNLTGTTWDAPITLTNGDYDGGTNYSKHFRINRAKVVFNTLVNNQHGIEIGYTNNGSYTKPPRDFTIANNIVVSSENQLVKIYTSPANCFWSNNILWPSGSAEIGNQLSESEAKIINPDLDYVDSIWVLNSQSPAIDSAEKNYEFVLEDIDGQSRDNFPDIGADEFSDAIKKNKPLTPEDVGPYAGLSSTTNINLERKNIPAAFSLQQNFPNPFNPGTVINFSVPAVLSNGNGSLVQLKIYDVLGNEIASLINEVKLPGNYSAEFNAAGLSSGVYFYRITIFSNSESRIFSQTKKMVLIK